MKFTLKPKDIEAVEYRKGVAIAGSVETSDGSVFVHSISGKVKLTEGDYVIGEAGKYTVMAQADFEAMYELVKKAKKAAVKKAPAKKAAKKK